MQAMRNQKGGFSPFMFGVLIGLSVFSTMAAQWAREDLKKMQQERLGEQQKQAEDIARAVELSILTESADGSNPYSNAYSLSRSQGFFSRSTGKTRGNEDVQFRSLNSATEQGIQNKRVVIGTSDDQFHKSTVDNIGSATAANTFESGVHGYATVDTGAARDRQVLLSRRALEAEISELYVFYASNGHFPADQTDYDSSVNSYSQNHDFWGRKFTYHLVDAKNAQLSFTTPWGRNMTLTANMD